MGLALVAFSHGRLRLERAELGRTESGLAGTLIGWLQECDQAVIAIDAPLGWPSALGKALSRHQAGERLVDEAHLLFRRATDRFIKARIGKQSLDVGADRIARTAFAALGLLNRIREGLRDEIPLAWTPASLPRWSAIEVYPAATLRSHRIPDKGYKDVEAIQPRTEVLRRLRLHLDTGGSDEAEAAAVGKWLSERTAEGVNADEIGVFVRSTEEIPRAQAAVKAARLSFVLLDRRATLARDRVSIGTMHSSKGLEFRAVVVMACDDEILPLQERIQAVTDEGDLDEVYNTERHLLYVACTRARDHLLVSGAAPVSEFLNDLGGVVQSP